VQLFGPDGRYLCFHVLLLDPRERNRALHVANVVLAKALKNTKI
jgi:hypothetical protein